MDTTEQIQTDILALLAEAKAKLKEASDKCGYSRGPEWHTNEKFATSFTAIRNASDCVQNAVKEVELVLG